MKAVSATIIITSSIYFLTSTPCLYMYGTDIDRNLFNNIGMEKATLMSVLLRIEYILVICCHIPYFFFASKECLLIMIDELMRSTISNSLKHRLEDHE